MRYLDTLSNKVKNYFYVLEPNIPDWLDEYIESKNLQKQKYVSVSNGMIYTKMVDNNPYSSLEHSVAVALIIWHFTHDKKQTLSGLFHDIATPVFKHAIDFLNGDYMKQESTEYLTSYFIKTDKKIMSLLKRDGIKLEEVDNYHIYPVADNETPHLAADRLEYSLSNAYIVYNNVNVSLEDIRKIYNDIEIETNEYGIQELGFKTLKIAEKFVKITSKLSILYRDEVSRYTYQFLADIVKKLNEDEKISKKDLFEKKESEIIKIIENSKYKKEYEIWKTSNKIHKSKYKPKNVYYVNQKAKIRYINPLVKGKRIYDISDNARKNIDKNLSYKMDKYIYLDLNF